MSTEPTSNSFLGLPPEIHIRILRYCLLNLTPHYALKLIHPRIAALCDTHLNDKDPTYYRSQLISRSKFTAYAFLLLAVYELENHHPGTVLPESIHDLTVSQLKWIGEGMQYIGRLDNWLCNDLAPSFTETVRKAMLFPDFAEDRLNSLMGTLFWDVLDSMGFRSALKPYRVLNRWTGELVHLVKPKYGGIYKMVCEELKFIIRLWIERAFYETWREEFREEFVARFPNVALPYSALPPVEMRDRIMSPQWDKIQELVGFGRRHGLKGLCDFIDMTKKYLDLGSKDDRDIYWESLEERHRKTFYAMYSVPAYAGRRRL